jgi:TolA-binding protein
VVTAANQVLTLNNAGSDDQTEAHFYLGKVAYTSGDLDKAFNEFTIVSKASSGVMGAESAYRIAEIYYGRSLLKQAEEQRWYVIKSKPTQDYWIAKSYLLIADIYTAQGDFFQAKSTLQSVIDNYKGSDDIIPSAKQKLEEVKKAEANKSKLQPDNLSENDDSESQ